MAYFENLQATVQNYDSVGSLYQNHIESTAKKGYEHTTLIPLLGDLSGKTVLDVGSGTGRWSRVALQLGASHVYALEPSPVMDAVAVATEKELHIENVQHLRGDICNYDLGTLSVDVAIIGYVLNHLSSREQVLQALKNVYGGLKPGGLLVGVNSCVEASAVTNVSSSKLYRLLPDGNHEWGRAEYGSVTPEMRLCYFIQRWETIRGLLEEAGFKDVQRAETKTSEELASSISAMSEQDADVYREITKHPAFFSARK